MAFGCGNGRDLRELPVLPSGCGCGCGCCCCSCVLLLTLLRRHLHSSAHSDGLVGVDGLAERERVTRGREERLELVLQRQDARRAAHQHAVRDLVRAGRRGKKGGLRG